MPKTKDVKIQCEDCDEAYECKKLNPYKCEKFSLALSTNFNAEVELVFDKTRIHAGSSSI